MRANMTCKVSVNISDLMSKCPDSFKTALAQAAQTYINIDLNKLVKDPKVFADVLCYSIDKLSSSPTKMGKVILLYNKSIRTPELDTLIGNKVISQLEAIQTKKSQWRGRARYRHGKDVPKIIEQCIDLFNDESRQKLLKLIFEKNEDFYPYARKMLIATASLIAEDESDLINILNNFYKIIDRDTFYNIIGKINGGMDNDIVKKIISRTKKFNVCKYTKAEIKSDRVKKIQLLKDIARTPTSVKNLNFKVVFGASEIEELAPIMRFNLLKWYYKEKFRAAAACYRFPNNLKTRLAQIAKTSPTGNITISSLKEVELKKLLFSVGLKKNAEVSQFMTAYDGFKQISQGIMLSRAEARSAFGRVYSYYYW